MTLPHPLAFVRPRFLPALVAALTVSASAQAATIAFDSAPEFTGNFTVLSANSGQDSMAWSASSGVGGVAGRLQITAQNGFDSTALCNTASWDTGNSSSTSFLTLSMFFLTPSPNTGTDGAAAQIGFSESLTNSFLTGNIISARVRSSGSAGNYVLEGRYSNSGSFANVNATSAFSLSNGTWYRLATSFYDNGTGFTYSAVLENWGSGGNSFSGNVTSINGTMAQTSLLTDGQAYAGVRTFSNSGVAVALDQFSVAVVPEPGTAALGAVAALALLSRRSRRTSL